MIFVFDHGGRGRKRRRNQRQQRRRAFAQVSGTIRWAGFAGAALQVQSAALLIRKDFADDPIPPGGQATLEFSITNFDRSEASLNVAFADDLDATLSGLVAVGLPASSVCGAGSQLNGTGLLTLTGGSLGPGGSCTFQATLQVPASAVRGTSYHNTTSEISGTADGPAVAGPPAQDSIEIDFVRFRKAFDSGNAPPDFTTATGTPELGFTIENLSDSQSVSNISFTDNLDAALSGLVATGPPLQNVCGTGSSISGTSLLTFSGGELGTGESCTFSVPLSAPAGAAAGTYTNTTSDLFSSGLPLASPASDELTVEPPPTFSKTFSPDSIGFGQTSTIAFTIDNSASALAASDLTFTDNLPAGMLVADPPAASDSCSGGTLTAVAGTGTISYSGGSVAAGSSCSISANVQGTATGSLGNSGTASDSVTVVPPPAFSKRFEPDTIPVAGACELIFAIDNGASVLAAENLAFDDVFPAEVVVSAFSPPASTNCPGGIVTTSPGSGSVAFSGANLAAAASCTVRVPVTGKAAGAFENVSGLLTSSIGTSGSASSQCEVRADVTASNPGVYRNVSMSLLSSLGISEAPPETLTVLGAPAFYMKLSPDRIRSGDVARMTLTIDNTRNTDVAENLAFIDNLGSQASVADPPNASTTCDGGFVVADAGAGAGTISFENGTVMGGLSCEVAADIEIRTYAGICSNETEDLVSSLGNSGSASAWVRVGRGPEPVPAPSLGAGGMAFLAALISWATVRGLRRRRNAASRRQK